MPKYEILHSGQYWQDVRRRAKEAREAISLREARAQSLSRTFGDGGQIFTFVPGRAQPFTNLMDRSGKLHRVSELSSAGGHDEARAAMLAASWKKRHSAEEKARALRAKKLQQKAEEVDAELIARLKGERKNGRLAEDSLRVSKKRKLAQDAATAGHR
ncbi:hypothetical protein B0H14DRAFT_3473809 [Mycena olivaceomarginata]|nr:hypothetical protein B0H14DRAFT_3473809 [Mycena olivaceomarginata]